MNRISARVFGLALLVSLPTFPAVAQVHDIPGTPITPAPSSLLSPLEELGRERILDHHREAGQRMRKPALGVVLAPDPASGVRIAAVTPSGAAAAAGLRSGDRLLSIDGQRLRGDNGAQRVNHARELLADLDTNTALRVGYARDGRQFTLDITPRLSKGVVVWTDGSGQEIRARGDFVIMSREDLRALESAGGSDPLPPGVAPRISREVMRLGPGGGCQGNGCATPTLLEAFRWNGLNLAAIDPALGQYFGTRSGVLVISAGPKLVALQPGDVILKIGDSAVATPREAMDALRAAPAGSQVALEILRNRKQTTARIRIPEAMLKLPPLPPAQPTSAKPPAPVAPPSAQLDRRATAAILSTVAFAPATPPEPSAMPSNEFQVD